MTRQEALLKLVALGPVCRDEVQAITHWPWLEVHRLIDNMVREGLIAWAHMGVGSRMLVLTPRTEPQFAGWNVSP